MNFSSTRITRPLAEPYKGYLLNYFNHSLTFLNDPKEEIKLSKQIAMQALNSHKDSLLNKINSQYKWLDPNEKAISVLPELKSQINKFYNDKISELKKLFIEVNVFTDAEENVCFKYRTSIKYDDYVGWTDLDELFDNYNKEARVMVNEFIQTHKPNQVTPFNEQSYQVLIWNELSKPILQQYINLERFHLEEAKIHNKPTYQSELLQAVKKLDAYWEQKIAHEETNLLTR